jgi:hypothetical protein
VYICTLQTSAALLLGQCATVLQQHDKLYQVVREFQSLKFRLKQHLSTAKAAQQMPPRLL